MFKRFLAAIALALGISLARGEALPSIKDPLNYPLRQYGFILAVAMLGGAVSFWAKVRAGDVKGSNVAALIGELTTSAFAGLLMFWICEYASVPPVLTAALAGLAGHAGGRGVAWLEDQARRKAERALGNPPEKTP